MRKLGKIAELLLYVISIKDERSSIIGDYTEMYNEMVEEKNLAAAKLWLWSHILLSIPMFIKHHVYWGIIMFATTMKISYRTIKRDKLTFFINFIGLTTGLICVFFIYFWVNDELNVDKFHERDSQLFSVFRNRIRPNGIIETAQGAPGPLAQALKDEMPEVEYAVAVNYMTLSRDADNGIIYNGNNHINVKGQFAGKDYFHVFSYPLIKGDKDIALENKNGIVITEALAIKLFNTAENIIGKTVNYKHQLFEGTFQISGICQNPPSSSTIQFDIIFSFDLLLDQVPAARKWTGSFADAYLILRKGTDIEHFNNKIKNFIELKHPKNKNRTLFIQQYSQKYLYGNFENGVQAGGRIFYVKLFSIIAVFILIIACANFINLSTAKASIRAKEIGIKKSLGVKRKSLIIQFFSESLLMIIISAVFAIGLALLLCPVFNEVIGKEINFNFSPKNILFVLGIILFTGIISGSYPALYISRYNPVIILKGIKNTSKNDIFIRKALVIFQFIISVTFIAVFFAINQQIDFILSKNLGYDSDNIILFERRGRSDNYNVFLTELKNLPGVENASSMNNNLLEVRNSSRLDSWEGKIQDGKTAIIPYPSVNYDFIETMGIKIMAGRSFSNEFQNENNKVIINESAVKMMGLKDPVGKIINIDRLNKEIIGVVNNFHFESLYKDIEPLAVKFNEYGSYIYVKLKTGEEKTTVDRIKKLYEEFHEFPFEFSFLDDTYKVLYESEVKLAGLVKYASAMTIIISCLGLFGLAAFTSQKRFKEICIRKILGSSVNNILFLLSFDFIKILILSILIALPASYMITSNWLNQFANKITLEWWIFVGTCFITLILGWLSIGIQMFRLASVNPVRGLRNE